MKIEILVRSASLNSQTDHAVIAGDLRHRRNPQVSGFRNARRQEARTHYWPTWSTRGIDITNEILVKRLKAKLRKEWNCAKCKRCGGPSNFTKGKDGGIDITPKIPSGIFRSDNHMVAARDLWNGASCRGDTKVLIEPT